MHRMRDVQKYFIFPKQVFGIFNVFTYMITGHTWEYIVSIFLTPMYKFHIWVN